MTASADPQGRVLVFARAPVAGASKTRLIPALGAEGAARLSARLLRHTLETARDLPLELWCSPSTDHPVFARSAADFRLPLRAQRGADLGARMLNAVTESLRGAPWVIVIGCDCPQLTREDLAAAAAALESGYDAALGPAQDGGYYLLGLCRAQPALFHKVAWGTGRVLGQTRTRLREAGWHWHELPVRRDVDRPEDLAYFPGLCDSNAGGLAC